MIVLETGIIQLREMTRDDLEDLHSIFSDPITMQYYPKPFDRQMTIDWIDKNINRYQQHGFGLWAVIHTGDKRLIGDCGLTYQNVDGIDELEIGYHIMRSYWGKGLATLGAIACRDYAFDNLKKERVISWINPENTASRRVADKVGMHLEKETIDNDGRMAVVYSMRSKDRD